VRRRLRPRLRRRERLKRRSRFRASYASHRQLVQLRRGTNPALRLPVHLPRRVVAKLVARVRQRRRRNPRYRSPHRLLAGSPRGRPFSPAIRRRQIPDPYRKFEPVTKSRGLGLPWLEELEDPAYTQETLLWDGPQR